MKLSPATFDPKLEWICRLRLKAVAASIPELGLGKYRIEESGCVTRPQLAVDTLGARQAINEAMFGIMARSTADRAVSAQTLVKEQRFSELNFFRQMIGRRDTRYWGKTQQIICGLLGTSRRQSG